MKGKKELKQIEEQLKMKSGSLFKGMSNLEKKAKKGFRRLQSNKRGVIYVWVMIIISMFVYSVIWFTAGWAAMEVKDAVETQYTFEGQASFTSDFIGYVFAYHPVIFFIGLILWGFVNSQRRDPRYEY